MEAAARPTRTKTPATAPVFLKNVDDVLEEVMLGLKVGLGFAIICVTVIRVPLFAVEVESVVKADGALVVSAPLLSVTVTKIGVESVEVGVRIEVESSDEGGRIIVEDEEKIGVEVSGGVEENEDEKDENEKDEDKDELEKDDEDETDDGGLTDGPNPEMEEEEKVLEEEEDEDEDMMEEKKEKEEEEEGRVVVVATAVAVVVRDAEADNEFEKTEEKDDDDIKSVQNQGIVKKNAVEIVVSSTRSVSKIGRAHV